MKNNRDISEFNFAGCMYNYESNVREMIGNTNSHRCILRSTMGIDLNCNVMRHLIEHRSYSRFEINIFAIKKHSLNCSLICSAHKVFYDSMYAPFGVVPIESVLS